jgi:hypothetical protein
LRRLALDAAAARNIQEDFLKRAAAVARQKFAPAYRRPRYGRAS